MAREKTAGVKGEGLKRRAEVTPHQQCHELGTSYKATATSYRILSKTMNC